MQTTPCVFRLQKHISGFTTYCVDSIGNVYSLRNGRKIVPSISHDGYYSVRFCVNTIEKRMLLHRLVLSSFCGYNSVKPNVDHIDNERSNNNLSNLRWITQSENVKRAYSQGRAKSPKAMSGKSGELHHGSSPIVGYVNGKEVIRFESISLARAASYHLDFYTKRKVKEDGSTNCKGINFKKRHG